ncbi:MAG: metalloprotease PmbA [Casimicrobiaceae bacterium]
MSLALPTEQLRAVASAALERAQAQGADQCEAEATQSAGLNVTVRMGELETLEHTGEQSLTVTVYVKDRKGGGPGYARGNATTSDFTPSAIAAAVDKAMAIARYTSADPCAGLADAADMAQAFPDLDLHHPWAIDVAQAQETARECEAAAFAVDRRIDNSEGATLSASENEFVYANSHGFMGGYRGSAHYLYCAVVASEGGAMERDHWYSAHRVPTKLESPVEVGRRAGERAVARLNPRKIATQTAPVLLAPWIASGFIGHAISALYGGALYRKTSFLVDSVGKRIFAPLVEIVEDPLIPQGYASAPFDAEGVASRRRTVVEAGVIQGYFLSAYSARKLGLRTTGNAGGNHNLLVRPTAAADLNGLARDMGRGLLVTEVMGQGVNPVTGDYSRGAAGFWVEGGELVHPVSEITISGNLLELYQRIVAIGSDIDRRGSKQVGSVLIESMQIAGA